MKIGNLEVYGIIYKISNKINGKVYIGQTKQGFNKRYIAKGKGIERVYNYYKKCSLNNQYVNDYLMNSINKYGLKSFEINETLDFAFSKKELDIKEECWVNIYNSFKNGYNCTKGGDGVKGLEGELNPSCKRVVQLDLEGNYIKTWNYMNEVGKELGIYQASSCSLGYQKTAGGYIFVAEEKYIKDDYVFQPPKWKIRNDVKKVVQISLYGEYIKTFENETESAKELNLDSHNISACCVGHSKSTGGFMFMFKEIYKENKNNIKPCDSKTNPKVIVQVSLEGEYIKTWYGSSNIEREIGVNESGIVSCCKGKSISAGGYQWFYKEKYNYNNNKRIHTGIEIIQLDLDGKFIKRWDNSVLAENELNINRKNINSALKNKCKSSGGFMWQYGKDYDNGELKKYTPHNNKKLIPVVQLNKLDTYIKKWDSLSDASNILNINYGNIRECCKNERIIAGGYKWIYYEDYIRMSKEEISDKLKFKEDKKIICITTGDIFDNVTFARQYCNVSVSSHINACCRGEAKSAGKHPITGEYLKWMYLEDYIKLQILS